MEKKAGKLQLDPREARRRKREWIIIFVTIALIAGATYMEGLVFRGEALVLPVSGNVLILGLININIILIILLLFLIIRNVVKLIFERRHGIAGSRLRTRLVAAFVGLSLVPTVLLFLVSINFLSYSIDNWFSIRIGDALSRTLEVAQIYYQQSAEQAKFYARQLSVDITGNGLYEIEKATYLEALVERRHKTYKLNMIEVQINNRKNNLILRDKKNVSIVPRPFSPGEIESVFSGQELVITEQIAGGDLTRGVVPIFSRSLPKEVVGFVAVSYYFPSGLTERVNVISKAYNEYQQLSLLKTPIKFGYIITLFIVMLLIIFTATWFGIYMARGITVPLQNLAEGTRMVAQGDLDHQIETVADDELGVLVVSFNQMTKDLRKSKGSLEQANTDLERRRNYMETVLWNVSAGVISIDGRGLVTMINRAAGKMLGINSYKIVGKRYDEVLLPDHLLLADSVLQEMRERGDGFIEKQIDVMQGERALTILITVTEIRDDEGREMGLALVFEDITQLQRAERAAAWREVARRMAHEIKNPLTPVQLSAQRLQRKYGDRFQEDGDVFWECTRTIIDQVEVLKNLVNEFSRYARLPVTNLSPGDLNETIQNSVILFKDAHREVDFSFSPAADIPRLMLDGEQIKRVMVNLLDNAVASLPAQNGKIAIISLYDDEKKAARVAVADNGCGIPPDYRVKMFEPYFSTKKTGTGLGLAIVSSIIEDHHGRVFVEDNPDGGTIVTFELPVDDKK
jgi:two-component system nitrogen regulation sensor histidine kinase NtrY